jgi:hypothetical protein
VTVAVGFAVTVAPVGGVASADGQVPLGGGAGITVNGTLCTLATIGHDKAGELVGFSAASCGGPGSPVAAGGGADVGSVVAVEDSLKYAVIKTTRHRRRPADRHRLPRMGNNSGLALWGRQSAGGPCGVV